MKNTTDPHVLAAFLSNYDDPVFTKLAEDRRDKLDDRAWQFAASARAEEAITNYIHVWSSLNGRHLQEAQTKLNEFDDDAWRVASGENTPEACRRYLNHPWTRHAAEAQKRFDEFDNQAWRSAANALTREAITDYLNEWSRLGGRHVQYARQILDGIRYWDIVEKDPEAKCGEPSMMYSISEGHNLKFYYEVPSKCLKDLPIHEDTLKFEGEKDGHSYRGTSYVFTRYCREKQFGYAMSGSENDDHTFITLRGPAPLINIKTCRIDDHIWDSNNSTLEFKAQVPAERKIKVKAKPRDRPDQIRR